MLGQDLLILTKLTTPYYYPDNKDSQDPPLLTWINFDSNMDK